RLPVTRSAGKKPKASNATKIGTEAWMIDARPESIRVSPHERSQNGTAMFTRPTTTSARQWRRSSRTTVPPPTSSGTTTASTRGAPRGAPPRQERRGREDTHRPLDEEERAPQDQSEQHQEADGSAGHGDVCRTGLTDGL